MWIFDGLSVTVCPLVHGNIYNIGVKTRRVCPFHKSLMGVAHMWEWEGVCRPVFMVIYFLAFMFVLESARDHSIEICVLVLDREFLGQC